VVSLFKGLLQLRFEQLIAINCMTIVHKLHLYVYMTYTGQIVCIQLPINMQDTPTTDSRGVLESISYASARKTS